MNPPPLTLLLLFFFVEETEILCIFRLEVTSRVPFTLPFRDEGFITLSIALSRKASSLRGHRASISHREEEEIRFLFLFSSPELIPSLFPLFRNPSFITSQLISVLVI